MYQGTLKQPVGAIWRIGERAPKFYCVTHFQVNTLHVAYRCQGLTKESVRKRPLVRSTLGCPISKELCPSIKNAVTVVRTKQRDLAQRTKISRKIEK